MKARDQPSFAFGPFVIDGERRRLLRDGEPVPLTRKAFDTLLVLLEHGGKVVDKEELLERVWPDTHVEENNLNQTISALRKALDDRAQEPKWIETVARRGYRFLNAARSRTGGPQEIAVLPFRLLGAGTGAATGAEDDTVLGVGLADTLITRLSGIERLVVRPTGAVLRFTAGDRDAVAAARELGVGSVLDGSIRRAGNRIRVTVQLVSVETGTSLWGEKFDEEVTDLFTVEDAISERVAHALARTLSPEETTRLVKRETSSAEAHLLYLQGRYFADRLSREGFEKSTACFERAIALDPHYAPAYAGMAYNYMQAQELILSPSEAMPRAEAAARKALALDASLGEARIVLAVAAFWYHRDWAAAEREAHAAIASSPRSTTVRRLFSWILVLRGSFDEGFAQLAEAAAVDPFSFEHDFYLMGDLYFARRFDDCIEHMRAMLREHPGFWLGHLMLGRALEQTERLAEALDAYRAARRADTRIPEALGDLGRALARSGAREEASAILGELGEVARTMYVSPYLFATIHAGLGDWETTLTELARAVEERSWYAAWLPVDPVMDPLRGDPRFRELLR
jgi:DNA-binding winged helix-turn-helix (wHTH) protein/Tfp pilus assembly protein PilF